MVSIIVPVYNVEKYLDQCISSVLSQTYQNWELLLIDDGSTDNSKEICDQYSKKDSRIKAIHKVNGGVSSARNLGLENAQGEYLMFLDSDDFWLYDNVLQLLVDKALSENLDVVRGEYVRVNESGDKLPTDSSKDKILKDTYTSFEMVKYIINGEFFSFLFLFKTRLVTQFAFDTSLAFEEDMYFLIQIFCSDLRTGYLPFSFYAYRQLGCSASKRVNLKNVVNSFSFCEKFYDCAFKTSDKKLYELYIYNSIMMYYWTLETVASKQYIDKYREIDESVNLEGLRKVILKRVNMVKGKHFPLQIFVCPKLGIFLFHIRWSLGRRLRMLNLK